MYKVLLVVNICSGSIQNCSTEIMKAGIIRETIPCRQILQLYSAGMKQVQRYLSS